MKLVKCYSSNETIQQLHVELNKFYCGKSAVLILCVYVLFIIK